MAQQRLFAFVTEHPLSHKSGFRGGKYNGYVGIIEDTTNIPSYTDSRIFDTDYYIKVHGGVTFDGTLKSDTFILPLTDVPENWFDYRVIGFDCNHSGDKNKEWSLDYVKEQTMSMMHQIEKHLDNPYNDADYPKEEIIESDTNVISNGLHTISGIGDAIIHDDWNDEDIDVDLFCIDGVTYGAWIDPDDGYRSYGVIKAMPEHKCQYTFPPQSIKIENKTIKGNPMDYFAEDKTLFVMTDATNGKEVLVVGTDYSDNYYPNACFKWQPENLEVNQGK